MQSWETPALDKQGTISCIVSISFFGLALSVILVPTAKKAFTNFFQVIKTRKDLYAKLSYC
jgi:hypothetical protein